MTDQEEREKYEGYLEWEKLSPTSELNRKILRGIQLHNQTRQWKAGFILPISEYLKHHMWEDWPDELLTDSGNSDRNIE